MKFISHEDLSRFQTVLATPANAYKCNLWLSRIMHTSSHTPSHTACGNCRWYIMPPRPPFGPSCQPPKCPPMPLHLAHKMLISARWSCCRSCDVAAVAAMLLLPRCPHLRPQKPETHHPASGVIHCPQHKIYSRFCRKKFDSSPSKCKRCSGSFP